MTPSQASLDPADMRLRNTICSSDGALWATVRTNSQNITGRKPDVTVRDSAGTTLFYNHVARIIRDRSKEQVVDVYAGRDVAPVADHQAIRDRPMRQGPRQPMCAFQSSVPLDQPISAMRERLSGPKRTPLRVLHGSVVGKCLLKSPAFWAPKSFSLGGSHHGTSNAAVGQGRCRRFSVARPAHNITASYQ